MAKVLIENNFKTKEKKMTESAMKDSKCDQIYFCKVSEDDGKDLLSSESSD